MELRILTVHDAELRVFSPRASFIRRSTSACLWRKPSRRHESSSKQQLSKLIIFAVTVIVVALDRSLYFISFPAAS